MKVVCGCDMDPLIPGCENLHAATQYNEVQAKDIIMFTFRALADRGN